MKNKIFPSSILVCCILLFACDENDVMPSYAKKGSTTATVASVTASNTSPLAGQSIKVTLDFVNPASDPVETIVLRAKVGAGGYTDLQTFDEQSSAKDVEISREVTYVTPATPTTVTFEMVISSQKEYAQINRTSISVK